MPLYTGKNVKKTINARLLDTSGKPPKRITYTDASTKNLIVMIWPSGNIYWMWQGKVAGRTRQVHIGQYPAMGVAEARRAAAALSDARDAAKMVGEEFELPRIRNRAVIEKQVAEAIVVPEATASRSCQWLWDEYMKRDGGGKASSKEKQRCWDKDFKPIIGHIPYSEITYDDVADIIAEIAEDRVPHANHLVSYIKRCFRWAVTKGRPFTKLEIDPLTNLVQPGAAGVKDRAFDEQEIIWFFKTVDAFGDEHGFTTALTMILYNGVRRTEMFAMPWAEYTASSGQWLIPGKRTKNGDPLLLPLSPTSQALLKARRGHSGNHPYVFPASRGDGPLAGYQKRMEAFRAKMMAIAGEERGEAVEIPNWTLHDLRRTLRTGMGGLRTPEGESLIQQHICERVINHRLGKMVGTYDTNEYLVEKRRALLLWSDQLDILRAEARQSAMKQAA